MVSFIRISWHARHRLAQRFHTFQGISASEVHARVADLMKTAIRAAVQGGDTVYATWVPNEGLIYLVVASPEPGKPATVKTALTAAQFYVNTTAFAHYGNTKKRRRFPELYGKAPRRAKYRYE
jgi:hypothetical protein